MAATKEKIEIASTSCKDCIFAIYDNKTQVDCSFERLDIYIKQRSAVEVYDDDKEFYVIDTRICNACRNSEWETRQKSTDLRHIVRQEIKMTFDVIIIAEDSIDDILFTIHSLLKEDYKPKQFSILRRIDSSIRPSSLSKELSSLSIKWRIKTPIEEIVDERLKVDELADTCTYPYYVIVRAGSTLPENYLHNLDIAWNDKLLQLGVVICSPTDPLNGMMVSTSIHKYILGNKGFDIEFKIKEYNDTLLHKYEELCNK